MIHTQIIIGATSYDSYSDNHLLALSGSNNAGFSNDTRLSSGCQQRRSGNMQHSTNTASALTFFSTSNPMGKGQASKMHFEVVKTITF